MTYNEPEEIDSAMFNRYKGKTNFKVGQGERVIYERVAGLKRVNINHSILYNFCSEGAFPQLGLPISLFVPTPEQSVTFL